MINNIKAYIRYITNTTDEYDIKHKDETLDGELTINQTGITEGDTVDAVVRGTKFDIDKKPRKTKNQRT